MPDDAGAEVVAAEARPLPHGVAADEELIALAAGARCVLLGEASHGTQECYSERAAITRRLIGEPGLTARCRRGRLARRLRVNCYVRGPDRR